MNRLSNNDKSFGPITVGKWWKNFSAYIQSGDDDDKEAHAVFSAFGWAVRTRVPNWMLRPWKEKWVECNWDAETVKRLGRSGYWSIYPRQFGFSLSDMGNGYDFLQLFLGPQTHDSSTTKSWSKHLPWKQWDHVRNSLYDPMGNHFYTEQRTAGFLAFLKQKEACPKSHFSFEDYDKELIVATCTVEEREWHKGCGWFKWLRWFSAPRIRRSLDLAFSAEVGPQKGFWKGGTLGHGIDMLPNESAEDAFRRYCDQTHKRKGQEFKLRFIGPCAPPPPRVFTPKECDAVAAAALP